MSNSIDSFERRPNVACVLLLYHHYNGHHYLALPRLGYLFPKILNSYRTPVIHLDHIRLWSIGLSLVGLSVFGLSFCRGLFCNFYKKLISTITILFSFPLHLTNFPNSNIKHGMNRNHLLVLKKI